MSTPRKLRKALSAALETLDEDPTDANCEPGLPGPEAPLMEVQMAKACRMLELARDLIGGEKRLTAKGYYTASVETAFAAIERSMHAYLLANDVVTDEEFLGHEAITKEAGEAGLFDEETADYLEDLWRRNRSKVYYRAGLPTKDSAEAMVHLAREVHQLVRSTNRRLGELCAC